MNDGNEGKVNEKRGIARKMNGKALLTSNGGKMRARKNFPPQFNMLVMAMAMGRACWSNSSAAMNQEMGPGPSS